MLHFSGVNIIFLYLRHRLTDESCAEGSLILGKLNHDKLCVLVPLNLAGVDAYNSLLERGRRRRLCLPCPKEVLDVLQVLLNGYLAFLERLHLVSKRLQFFTSLPKATVSKKSVTMTITAKITHLFIIVDPFLNVISSTDNAGSHCRQGKYSR